MKFQLALSVAIVCAAGCSQSNQPTTAGSRSPDQVATLRGEDSKDRAMSDAESDSATARGAITVDSPPEDVCREFIECLRRGDSSRAEKFLSQESISQTRKHSLNLATPAGPGASYSIQPPMFATTQKKIAFVSIEVSETNHQSPEPQAFSMMLRNGSFGWKICGIMLGTQNSGQDLYSFENPMDVMRIKSMIDGDEQHVRAAQSADSNHYQ